MKTSAESPKDIVFALLKKLPHDVEFEVIIDAIRQRQRGAALAVEEDIVVKMPPKRRYAIDVEIRTVKKAKPRPVVELEQDT